MKLVLLTLGALGLLGASVCLLVFYWCRDRPEDLGRLSAGWCRAQRRRQLERNGGA